jgi:hypothetical protein
VRASLIVADPAIEAPLDSMTLVEAIGKGGRDLSSGLAV